MSRSPSPFPQAGHGTVPSNQEYHRRRICYITSFPKPSVEASGRTGEGDEGGERQNEPRAIISMARQLRSSRGHLLLRARRPDDRSSFNNLPPVPSHRATFSLPHTPTPISPPPPRLAWASTESFGAQRQRCKLRNR